MGRNMRFMLGVVLVALSYCAALGARIRIQVATVEGTRNIYATVGTGASFGGSSLQQEIGLRQATAIKAVEVTWPATGARQLFTGLEVDQYYSIREGDPRRRSGWLDHRQHDATVRFELDRI